MCSLVMNLCSREVITIHLNGSRLTGLTCSKAPGFWMVEHQLVTSNLPSIANIFQHFTINFQTIFPSHIWCICATPRYYPGPV